ncbi:MAG: DnaD domain protein, partial [Anaerovoracaceae bacterium]
MAFKKEKSKTWYLLDTQVENLFICEYMPDTPGDYVKVYLYALMEAGRGGELSEGDLAKRLNLSSQDVAKAFLYFEQLGMMKRVQGDMELFSLKERLYGNKNAHRETVATEKGRKILDNGPLKEMIREIQMATGCFLSTVEATEILSWMTDYNASAEVIAGAYVYCNEKGKTNYKYVGKVVKDWVSRGFATKEDIEKYLGETDQRHYAYSRVMKALGFHRTATEEEKRIIDQWMDELNCSMDSILAACGKTAGIPNPNIRYVNAVLTNKRETGAKPVSRNSVKEYYEQLRQAATERAEAAREEVYLQLPRIKQIEDHLV